MVFRNRRKLRRRTRLPELKLTDAAAVAVIKALSGVAGHTKPKAIVVVRNVEELLNDEMLTTDCLDHFVKLLKKT